MHFAVTGGVADSLAGLGGSCAALATAPCVVKLCVDHCRPVLHCGFLGHQVCMRVCRRAGW